MDILNGNIYLSSNIFLKGSNIYELNNQLTILGIYNYHGFLLLIARFLYKKIIIYFVIIYIYSMSQNPKNLGKSKFIIPLTHCCVYELTVTYNTFSCVICQVIYFILSIHMIEQCNDPQ